MDISVTDFKAHCLDFIRKVEAGATVTIDFVAGSRRSFWSNEIGLPKKGQEVPG